ncbi:MAG: TIGR02186 family protein [Devosia sp.]
MRAALVVLAVGLATPTEAERLVSTVSNPNVAINSSFEGAGVSLFGNILPDLNSPTGIAAGPYNIVITVTGPSQDRVARVKTNSLGIWSNTDQQIFTLFPSYYAVIASGRLGDIADPATLERYAVLPGAQAALAAKSDTLKAERFGLELVRMMEEEGHLSVNEDGVQFLSDTAYTARVNLPSDVANGPFIAHTMVFKNSVLVAERSDGFTVRKSGFERDVFLTARQQPLLYGLACVLLAVATGWLAGVVFRR